MFLVAFKGTFVNINLKIDQTNVEGKTINKFTEEVGRSHLHKPINEKKKQNNSKTKR